MNALANYSTQLHSWSQKRGHHVVKFPERLKAFQKTCNREQLIQEKMHAHLHLRTYCSQTVYYNLKAPK